MTKRPIKAITIWQPHASFLMIGDKQYETRSWGTAFRGEMAIHAGVKRFDPRSAEYRYFASLLDLSALSHLTMEELPRGCILGTARLIDCHKIDRDFIEQLTERELYLGDFSLGRFAWEFAEHNPFEKPIPFTGSQGLWDWSGTDGAA